MSDTRVSISSVTESDEGKTWVATGTVVATSDDDEELSYSIASFQDEAGNTGTSPSVSIEYGGSDPSDPIIIDTVAPVITSVSASLSKSDTNGMYLNQKRAEPGDTITLTIEANEPLDYLEDTDVLMSDTRVSISSVTESDEGRTWVATGTVVASSALDEELSYSIASFQDEAGNTGTPPSVSIEYGGSDPSDPIIIDTVAPVITSVSASLSKSDTNGMYLNQKRAEPGDTITLTIKANEPLDYLGNTDVSMSDTRVSISSVTESDEGKTWVATGTVVATSDDDEELSYSIASFQDEAGNTGTSPSVSIEYGGSDPSDPIVIDTIAPVITSVSASLSKSDTNGMYLNQKRAEPGDTITLTIKANEPLDYLGNTDVSMSGTRVSISSVTESDEGRTWVATGTVVATSDDDEELSYSIASFQDEAGNSGTSPEPHVS